ncbi:MAG: restriction endonuclease subunit S, partial [Gimesia chilikensis]
MSESLNELPEGWVNTSLQDICKVIMGQSPPSTSYRTQPEGLPFFQGKAEFGDLYPKARKWCIQPNKIAIENDILLSIRAPVGPTNLANQECCIGRGLAALRTSQGVSFKYLLNYLRYNAVELDRLATGTTFKAVSGKTVSSFPIRLAPENEQKRIVNKIESLQTRSQRARKALAEVGPLLEQFRQSVLAAAFRGDLTADWRAAHPDVEPASVLLERIREERRQKWEAAELAKDNQPPKGWRQKYKEPEKLLDDALAESERTTAKQNGWGIAALELFVDPKKSIPYGIVKTGDPVPNGVPT